MGFRVDASVLRALSPPGLSRFGLWGGARDQGYGLRVSSWGFGFRV